MKSKINDLQRLVGTFSVNRNIDMSHEIRRKLFHLLIAILPISYFFFSKTFLLLILVPICGFIVLFDHLRHKNDKIKQIFNHFFDKMLRDHERNSYTAATFFSIGAIITFSLFSKVTAINAFLILAISDSSAAIFGKKIISRNFFEKSLAGSIAFFVSAVLIVTITGIIFNESMFYYVFAIIAALVCTIIEARPSLLNFNDNLTIPVSYSLAFTAFTTIWF